MRGRRIPLYTAPSIRVDVLTWRYALRHPDGPDKSMLTALMTLSTWASLNGADMWPSIERVAVAAKMNRKTVGKAFTKATMQGWVHRKCRGAGYEYAASIPAAFREAHPNLRAWERDPQYVSERRRRGRSPPEVHASVVDTDGVTAQAASPECPCPQGDVSLPTLPTVHALRPLTTSETKTVTSGEVAKSAGFGIEERRVLRGRRREALKKEPSRDRNSHVLKCFQIREAGGQPLNPFNPDDLNMAAVSSGYSLEQTIDAVHQLLNEGRLPLPPEESGGLSAAVTS